MQASHTFDQLTLLRHLCHQLVPDCDGPIVEAAGGVGCGPVHQ